MVILIKQHLLNKKLLFAVTCAMSIQMLCTPPGWADTSTTTSDSTQTVATQPTDSEATDTESEEAKKEAERKKQLSSSSLRSFSAYSSDLGSNDYGIMPMAASTIVMQEDAALKSLALGTNASFNETRSSIAIGYNSKSYGGSVAIGVEASTVPDNSVAIGSYATVTSRLGVAIGDYAAVNNVSSVAIGPSATANNMYSIAIGGSSSTSSDQAIAIGDSTKVTHKNSVAIGYEATTGKANQVSFGTTNDNGITWTARRSLGGVSDIEMAGELSGVTALNGVAVSGSASTGLTVAGVTLNSNAISAVKSLAFSGTGSGAITGVTAINTLAIAGTSATTGLTVGGNAIIGKTNTPFSSTGFSVGSAGALTAASLSASGSSTIGGVTLNGNNITLSGTVDGVDVSILNTTVAGHVTSIANLNTATTGMSYASSKTTFAGALAASSLSATGSSTIGGVTLNGNNITLSGTVDGVDIAAMNTTVGGHTTSITNLNTATTGMSYASSKTTFAGALAASSLSASGSSTIGGVTLNGNNITLTGLVDGVDISTLNTTVGTKANQSDLTTLTTTVGTKANSADVYTKTEMNTSLATKASQTDLTTLTTTVGTKAAADASGLSAANKTAWKTALGVDTLSTGLDTNTDDISDLKTATTGMSYASNMTTFAGGLTASSLTIGSYGMDSAGALAAASFNGVTIESTDTKVGDYSLKTMSDNIAALQSNGGATSANTVGIGHSGTVGTADSVTTIEQSTSLSSTGISTNAITASGTVTGSEFVEGGTKLSAKYAAKGTVDTLVTTVGNASSGLVKDVADSKTATTGMSYAGSMTTFAGGLTASSLTIGSYGMTGAGALTAASFNGVTIESTDTKVGGYSLKTMSDNIAALQSNGGATSANTVGIGHSGTVGTADSVTTIESNTAITSTGINTNAITASGTVTGSEFVEGGTKLSAKYAAKGTVDTLVTTVDGKANKATSLAGYGITDAYTKTAVDTALADKADSATSLAGYGITDAYTKTYADSTFAKSADLSTISGKVTTNTTDIGLMKTATTGMSYASNMTTFVGGLTAASLSVSGSSSIGGVTIAGGYVDGVDVSALKTTVDNINTGGGGGGSAPSENTKGISRSGDGSSGSPYTTQIEGSTTISAAGISTNAITASGSIAAAEFSEGGTKLSAKYAAKAAVDTLATTVGNASSGLVKSVNDLQTTKANVADVYTKTDADSTFAKSVDLTALVGKSNTNTTDIATLRGVTVGMSYANGVTTLAGSLAATDFNGVTIDGSNGSTKINGHNLGNMAINIRDLQNAMGGQVGNPNTAGIGREGVDADGNGTTVIELSTSIDKNGLTTKQLAAASAQIGGVNFAAGGALTGVASINGMAFGNGTIGGVSLSGGKVNGVDVAALQNRVTTLENSGGGSGGGGTGGGGGTNTGGISRPDPGKGETVIEDSTTVGKDGIYTNNINASDKVIIAEGEDNQVTISKDGIHVGKNSSVVNDTDGFITDKGLYIGVDSSSDIASAKFSVAPNGNLTSKAGSYTFSNTAGGGAVFASSNAQYNTAFVAGGATNTTIKGNTITTGSVNTDKLIVNGTEVTVAGGTIGNNAVDNNLSTSDGGKDYNNRFTTSAMNGTTQSSSMKDGDTTVGFDVNTKYDGMMLTGSKTVTDKDGNVKRTETGSTKMTGDSITVSKDTVHKVKDADGKETEKTTTSSTNIGSGEITLSRENADGSRETIEVGSAISGLQSDVRSLDSKVSKMGVEIKEVGALSAALAGLHPMPEDAGTRTSMAMAVGSYEGKQALAVGGFYRPNKRTMLSLSGSFTTSKQMFNMGVSFALDKLPETKAVAPMKSEDKETLQMVLARLEDYQQKLNQMAEQSKLKDEENQRKLDKLEADNKKLAEDYAELKRQQEKK